MSAYIITYDLKNADTTDYEQLYVAIKECGTWSHYLESVWIVVVDNNNEDIDISEQIRNKLKKYIHKTDKIFVAGLSGEAAWHNLNSKNKDNADKWLNRNL